jgi:tRNA A37 threonylcarbamoyladenosine dehydratase
LKEKTIGTKGVKRIRETLKADIPLQKINSQIDCIFKNVTIVIPEEEAQNISHFQNTPDIDVRTKNGGLNEFVKEEVAACRHEITGEVESAKIKRVVDEDAILAAWREAGYPATW